MTLGAEKIRQAETINTKIQIEAMTVGKKQNQPYGID
jgi:hypothetical protein